LRQTSRQSSLIKCDCCGASEGTDTIQHDLIDFLLANVAVDDEMLKMLQFLSWNNKRFSLWVRFLPFCLCLVSVFAAGAADDGARCDWCQQ
jgi:hypothetical protein